MRKEGGGGAHKRRDIKERLNDVQVRGEKDRRGHMGTAAGRGARVQRRERSERRLSQVCTARTVVVVARRRRDEGLK